MEKSGSPSPRKKRGKEEIDLGFDLQINQKFDYKGIGQLLLDGKILGAKKINSNYFIKVGGGWVTIDQYIREYLEKNKASNAHKDRDGQAKSARKKPGAGKKFNKR